MARSDRSVEQLVAEAAHAAGLRALIEDPNVVALKAERVRRWVDGGFAFAVIVGLLFTMVTVQQFASYGFPTYSFTWWTAWLLDPMFSVALLAVLIAEYQTSRYQVKLDVRAEASKWFFLVTVLTMNTWLPISAGIPSKVILHAAPVVLVFMVAWIAPGIRDRLTESVFKAEEMTRDRLARAARDARPAVPPRLPAPELAAEAPVSLVVVSPPSPPSVPVTTANKPSSGAGSKPDPSQKFVRPDEELTAEIEKLWMDLGRRPGIGKVRDALGIGATRAEKLIASVGDPTLNGHRPRTEASR